MTTPPLVLCMLKHDQGDELHIHEISSIQGPLRAPRVSGPISLPDPPPRRILDARSRWILAAILPTWKHPDAARVRNNGAIANLITALRCPKACELAADELSQRHGIPS
jgi:hypothetical protein